MGLLSVRTLRLAAWAACAVTASLALGRLVLAIVEPEAGRSSGNPDAYGGGISLAAFEAVVLITFAAIGATVASRQPRNPVGWLLALIPLSLGLLIVSDRVYWQIVLTTGDQGGLAPYAAWLASWVWIPAMVPAFTLFPLLFPTGRPLSRRWLRLVWTAIVAGTLTFVGTAFGPGPLEDYPAIVNPLGIDSAAIGITGSLGFGVLVPTALAAIASLVVRFRRSRGAERQQLKWVMAAATLLPIAFAVPVPTTHADWGFEILLLSLVMVAAAVAIAMLRYRLYDIDVVINRALVYAGLSATLAGTYLGSILLLQLVLSGVTANNGLAIAGSTLAVAALFQPARQRIQAIVDRRFFRRKYDAARTLEGFGARLRDEVDLDALGTELRAVVAETMQPTHVSLWLRNADIAAAVTVPGRPARRTDGA